MAAQQSCTSRLAKLRSLASRRVAWMHLGGDAGKHDAARPYRATAAPNLWRTRSLCQACRSWARRSWARRSWARGGVSSAMIFQLGAAHQDLAARTGSPGPAPIWRERQRSLPARSGWWPSRVHKIGRSGGVPSIGWVRWGCVGVADLVDAAAAAAEAGPHVDADKGLTFRVGVKGQG